MIVALSGSGGSAGSSNAYGADYRHGEQLGQEFIQTYNVMSSPAQCQQGWSQVNTSLTGQALSQLRCSEPLIHFEE